MNSFRSTILLFAGFGFVTLCHAQMYGTDPHDSLTAGFIAADQEPKKAPLPIQELDEAPVLIKRTLPAYPESALKDSLEGTVYLRVTIDQGGGVEEIAVEKGVRKDLEEAAMACLKQWKFKPARAKGAAVRATVVVPFRFKLMKEPARPKTK